MHNPSFADVLAASRASANSYYLLIAFARLSGATFLPIMCVAKWARDLGSFNDLVQEAGHSGTGWDAALVAVHRTPGMAAAFDGLMTAVADGRLDGLLIFDRDGHPLSFPARGDGVSYMRACAAQRASTVKILLTE